MAKNILAFLGLVFLTLLIVGGVAVLGLVYDSIGIVALPEAVRQVPATLAALDEIRVVVQGPEGPVEWENPLEDLGAPTMPFTLPTAAPATATPEPTPTPEPTATLVPTPTPIPPLDPQVYRVATIERLKIFASALQVWVESNQKASVDPARMQDPAWQAEIRRSLDDVAASGRELAAVGPAPSEYRTIEALLDLAAQEADLLARHYTRGLDTGSAEEFQAAGEAFARLKGYLQQAAEQMLVAGWELR